MTAGPSERLTRLFEQASKLAGDERRAFLDRLRGEDESLATTLEELIHWDATDSGIRIDSKPFRLKASAQDDARRPHQGPSAEVLEQLSAHSPPSSRYEIREEVARGGMGSILLARDVDLDRELAMKVVLGPPELHEAGSGSTHLGLLLDEARIQGRMNHPGVVPVHELGRHPERGVYFTMQLVQGKDLGEIFQLVRAGAEGWGQVRAMHVLLRVCETMSYAHSKGILHRDLKPANIMVGRFGQVYVMDWGIAKVMGQEDPHDLRLSTSTSETGADEAERLESGPVLKTLDGRVVGTPSYMPIEQAEGRLDSLGPHSDVYAVGAMLYELLSGSAPYMPPEGALHGRAILTMILLGPPRPIHELNPSVPPELEAISEKAMARDPRDRYSDTSAMGEDILAYLEGRVVQAHRTGAVVELQKWVRRNRGLATAVGVAVLALVLGLIVSLILMAKADSQRRIASEERANVLRLRALQDLSTLVAEASAQAMWPPHPDRSPLYRAWLDRSDTLLRGLHPSADTVGHLALLEQVRARVAVAGPQPYSDAMQAEAWWLDQLQKLVEGLAAFDDEESGLTGDGVSPGSGWGMRRRLAFAEGVVERSVAGSHAAERWRVASEYARTWPAYRGLELEPQLGLLPIGADPESGWLEFAHLASGAEPERSAAGRIEPSAEMGVVLVLLPGGEFLMGSQPDPSQPNYSPIVEPDEGPVHPVALDPFFLSKYELTQGQWLAFLGENPATYGVGTEFGGRRHDLRHPVESVDWSEATRFLARMDLALPTEAQWEYGARAGTTSTWWFGEDETEARDAANTADAFSQANGGPSGLTYEAWDDGYTSHAPVGHYRANAFGLHDVCGNVWEWCRDHYKRYSNPPAPADGARTGLPLTHDRTARGGAFTFTAEQARSSNRYGIHPDVPQFNVGLRPARRLDR